MTRAFILSVAGAMFGWWLASAAAPASADDLNHLTWTFSAPIELPSVTLPAGSYIFKIPDTAGDRHIVQVFNSDGSQVLGTFLTIPEERLLPSAKTIVTFTKVGCHRPGCLFGPRSHVTYRQRAHTSSGSWFGISVTSSSWSLNRPR
jgi:hypothetical protein